MQLYRSSLAAAPDGGVVDLERQTMAEIDLLAEVMIWSTEARDRSGPAAWASLDAVLGLPCRDRQPS